MQSVARVQENVMGAFELEAIKAQVSNLLDNNPAKMEAFKTKILAISLSYGMDNCPPESIIVVSTAVNVPKTESYSIKKTTPESAKLLPI